MKRLFCVLLSALLTLSLFSCGRRESEDGVLKVVTTVFPPYDYVRQIASGSDGRVQVQMLLPPGSESHDYEPTLNDISAVGECDLFICVGGETDSWVDGVIESVGGNVNVVRLMDHVPLLCGNDHGHSHDHHGHGEEYDEHVWTTPENAAALCEAICVELCRLEPSLSHLFGENSATYASAFRELEKEYKSLEDGRARDVLIFADRFPFRYLTESMDLRHSAVFTGCSSDTEPSLSAIYRLTEEAKAEGVPVILTAEFYRGNTAATVADECGAQVMELHSCHNVTREELQSGVTCLELMRRNLDVLRKALR